MFREKVINFLIKDLKNAEDFLMLIQDLVDPRASFGANNEPKDITSDEEMFEVKINTGRKIKAVH